MKPVFQTKFGGRDSAPEDQGNCIASCLASIFEVGLEDVPDFGGKIVNGEWWDGLQEWLGRRNLSALMVVTEPEEPPRGWTVATVDSETLPKPDLHMVVAMSGRVIHDPNPRAKRRPEDYIIQDHTVFMVIDPCTRIAGIFQQ